MKVHLVLGVFERWVIVRADEPGQAWSGTRWVGHENGVPTDAAQVCNFGPLAGAVLYAQQLGFEIEKIGEKEV